MTSDELELIATDGEAITASPDDFSEIFYDTLFELAPVTRTLFPSDMTEQRGRLVGELMTLIGAATAWREDGSLDAFVGRAQQLGARHAGYGVHGDMYDTVEVALLAALRERVIDFDDDHEAAWTKLYRLVAETMREGAREHPASGR